MARPRTLYGVARSQLHSRELLSANLIRHAVRRCFYALTDRPITGRMTCVLRGLFAISEQFRAISYNADARQ